MDPKELKNVEEAGLGIEISNGKRMGGMLLADDFVGASESRESVQKLIDVVYRYCNRWRLKAKSAHTKVTIVNKELSLYLVVIGMCAINVRLPSASGTRHDSLNIAPHSTVSKQ